MYTKEQEAIYNNLNYGDTQLLFIYQQLSIVVFNIIISNLNKLTVYKKMNSY